ncbi:hypothetical protein F9B85_06725 [Heliorestis acidaminivorans]|uniref:DUF669 domain-containing protein n=1 Tax=Heliorestis acidaminivorans TaxID=553427 RepID=A0A6I0F192_9FIRM|nr:hypothetical protein [Heliorestis acidaminivorans]KAB2952957.1 hypothetical protein F9B85_06725 [Heliorestis acidaminivorans]
MTFEDFEFPKLIKDGKYYVQIMQWERVELRDGRRPVKWHLKLVGEGEGTTVSKFHWIDSQGGRKFFLNDLGRLGKKPTTSAEIERDLNSLVGALVEVEVFTENEAEGHQSITFLQKVR